MAYIINKFNGEQLIVLDDGTVDTSTSLGLVGKNYVGYGETQNENFVFLLENFANEFPPARPISGQIWFNTSNSLAYIYNGSQWTVIGSALVASTAPTDPSLGSLWIDSDSNQLSIWTGSTWAFIGPEAVAGFGITRARSTSLLDADGNTKPVVLLQIDGTIIAVCTNEAFTIATTDSISGFSNSLVAGINLSSAVEVNGNVTGRAGSADRLATPRTINNVQFDGQQNVVIKAATTNKLTRGTYLTGSDFDGTVPVTWEVDASSANVIGKVVARNSEGGFSAGTIAATFVGDLTGNVTATSGTSRFNVIEATTFIGATLSGNANSASQLATTRKINGVNFNGTSDITVPADANTLTGNTLHATVLNSSLTSVGTLTELQVSSSGISVGGASELNLLVESSRPTIRSSTGILNFDMGTSGPDVSFVNASTSLSLGGPNAPAIIGDNTTNLGIAGNKFDKVYANEFKGNADTATLAVRASNIAGGGSGSLLYQTGINATASLGIGAEGYVLKSRAGQPLWESLSFESLTKGSFLNFVNTTTSAAVSNFNSSSPVTVSVDATSANTANKVVARDSGGNFNATMITSGVTLLANPTAALHAAPKQYVDAVAGASSLPTGMINLWYGSVASIPAGWALCNGSNGTPDLRNRFVVGAGANYAVGAIGGTANAIVVSHSHSISDPGHAHNLYTNTGSPWNGTPRGVGANASATDGDLDGSVRVTGYDKSSVDINVASASTGVSISSAGSSGTNANLPPYYALCYIMKL